jgi:hypothetical protein
VASGEWRDDEKTTDRFRPPQQAQGKQEWLCHRTRKKNGEVNSPLQEAGKEEWRDEEKVIKRRETEDAEKRVAIDGMKKRAKSRFLASLGMTILGSARRLQERP